MTAAERFDAARIEIERIVRDLGVLIADENQNAGNPNLQRVADQLAETDRKWGLRRFSVAVTALVKAGKSSFVNALLGDELLPIANTPETARIVRVRHKAVDQPVLYDGGKEKAEGKTEIQAYLRARNERARETGKHNDAILDLDAPLAVLDGQPLGDYGFEILDTPGPNEAGAEHLATAVDRLIADADVVLYLLDYTKLKTTDEAELLQRLKASRGDLLGRVHDRLFFLVNKIDAEDRNGLSQDETCDYVASSLQQHLGVTVPKERILLLSASRALLARLVQSGQASTDALADFRKLVFGLLSDQERTDDEMAAAASSLLATSKLAAVEARTVDYLYQHRSQILFETTLEALGRHIQAFKGHLVTAKAASSADQGQLEEDIAGLESDVEAVQAKIVAIEEQAARFRESLKTQAATSVSSFRDVVKDYISKSFSSIRREQRRSHDRLGEALKLAFTGTSSREKAESALEWVNAELLRYVRDSAEEVRTKLEKDGRAEQVALYEQIRKQVNEMSRLVEAHVGRALNVELPETEFTVSLPSEQVLRQDLNERLKDFIRDSGNQITQPKGFCQDEERSPSNYLPDEASVMRYWLSRIDSFASAFEKAADSLIDGEVQDAVNAARRHIKTHAEGALKTIRHEMTTAQASEKDHGDRLNALAKRLDDVATLQDRRQRAIGFVAQDLA